MRLLLAKRLGSYIIGFVFTVILLIGGVGTTLSIILHFKPNLKDTLTISNILPWVGLIIAIFLISIMVAKFIRTYQKGFTVFGLSMPNVIYDQAFEDEINILDPKLIKKNRELEDLNKQLFQELEQKQKELDNEAYISDIFIRHHKNASRLVRSLLLLINEGNPNWKWEFCNNVLDECVTILLKDRADKSSSIYFINAQDELEMFAYNRIEFISSRNRKFKKGEGFAGHVWETGETLMVPDVRESNLFTGKFAPRHEYGSILGAPIKIANEVVGVLCIQSEGTNGFNEDDKITVNFYADICSLAHYYDIIVTKRRGNAEHEHSTHSL